MYACLALASATQTRPGDGGSVWVSPNGISWTPHTTAHNYLGNLGFGNGVFIATEGYTLLTSTNGIDWEAVVAPYLYHEASIFAEGRFVTVGSNGAIMTSTNGLDWSNLHSGFVDEESAGLARRFYRALRR